MMQLITAEYYTDFIDAITEMHRLRYRVFKERLDWDVQFSGDLEIDEFDALRPAYLIQRAHNNRVQGCVRLLPSTGPTMLRDTFPVLLEGVSAPCSPAVWESSRFALDVHHDTPQITRGLATATYELFAGMIEFGLSRRLTEILTVTDARMERIYVAQDGPCDGSASLARWAAHLRSRDILKFQLRAWCVFVQPVAFKVLCSGHRSRSQHRRS